MTRPQVLVTCPPMLGLFNEFEASFEAARIRAVAAQTTQTLSEEELIDILPRFDGWIIGDDPATRRVVEAAHRGKFRAAVKWGVGIDNVDFEAFESLGIPVENTPGVFGNEVADVALTYMLGLARETYWIDRRVRSHAEWPKPSGISMKDRIVGLVGFGDIGQQIARRLIACGCIVRVYDPHYRSVAGLNVEQAEWPDGLDTVDFLTFACPLNLQTQAMFNHNTLEKLKSGVRIVNVSRGSVIVEEALITGLRSGMIHSAALDVYEVEPLPKESELRKFEKCIFGTHNGSNSRDAVRRVSETAISKIANMLNG